MAVKAYFNAQGCRNRDGFKLMLRMNRIKAAPRYHVRMPGCAAPNPRPWAAVEASVATPEPSANAPR